MLSEKAGDDLTLKFPGTFSAAAAMAVAVREMRGGGASANAQCGSVYLPVCVRSVTGAALSLVAGYRHALRCPACPGGLT